MSETVIREIRKNAREHIRVGLGSFKGHELFSVRVWADKGDGTNVPTPKGITCAVALLPAIIEALQKTRAHARKVGVLAHE
jgi:hypothetical protein